jgi:hypothetical protein
MLVIVNLKMWEFIIVNLKESSRKLLPKKENMCLREDGLLG